jgi:F0F1-type ATP synthase epsilon subunit
LSDDNPEPAVQAKPVDTPPTESAASQEPKQLDSKLMHAKVYAPFKTYFDGMAESVSAVNDTGPFDILPKHHNFMTLLNSGDVIIRTSEGEQRITINRGVMHVKANQVIVFLDV